MAWSETTVRVADLTVGMGGHLKAFLAANPEAAYVLAADQDQAALKIAKDVLSDWPQIDFKHQNFEAMTRWVGESFDRIFIDLGVSSLQLDDASRGFSFRTNGPLDMRMNPTVGPSARDWLYECTEEDFVRVLRDYGEERRAPLIARKWVHLRKTTDVRSTQDFVEALGFHLDSKTKKGTHPLTKVFQAVRIHVNRELDVLDGLLKALPKLLKKNGRVGIISFHSLEDRLVKWSLRGKLKPINKKVIQATDEEIRSNPRSRSAKLRVYEKAE